jgi:glycosyltransferase involved in cell wall biosynthesis
MTSRVREIVYYGGEAGDIELIEGVGERLGVPARLRVLGGFVGTWSRSPAWIRNGFTLRIAHILSPWRNALTILREARSGQLILVKQYRDAVALLLLFSRFLPAGSRVIVTWMTHGRPPGARTRLIYRLSLRLAWSTWTYSAGLLRYYAEAVGIPAERLRVAPLHAHPVDPALFDLEPEEDYDVIMTGISGRDWEMFHDVCLAMPDLRFRAIASYSIYPLLGDAPNLVKSPAIPFPEYCREFLRAKVCLLLIASDFGALGQRDLLLFGTLSLPVIATDTEALHEYGGDEGAVRYVGRGDVEATCRAIRELLGQPERRREMGEGLALRVRDHYTFEKVADWWADELRPLVEGKADLNPSPSRV